MVEKFLNFHTVEQKPFFSFSDKINKLTMKNPTETNIHSIFPLFLGIFRKLPDFASWTCLANFEISKIAQSG